MSYSLSIEETSTGGTVSIIQGKCTKCQQPVPVKQAVRHVCKKAAK